MERHGGFKPTLLAPSRTGIPFVLRAVSSSPLRGPLLGTFCHLPALLLLLSRPAAASEEEETRPFPRRNHLQYGAAVVAETSLHPGDVCPPDAQAPCILQGGGGLTVRAGFRSSDDFYLGGSYTFTRHDSANLLVLPILQQMRFEGRKYFPTGTRLDLVAQASAGLTLYGSEWRADTVGINAALGGGFEFQVSPQLLLGLHFAYRPQLFHGWIDATGQERAGGDERFGLAHFFAIELSLELLSPLSRW